MAVQAAADLAHILVPVVFTAQILAPLGRESLLQSFELRLGAVHQLVEDRLGGGAARGHGHVLAAVEGANEEVEVIELT